MVQLEKALSLANARQLDLVEVAPGSRPSVCKLLDYGKHSYQEKKKKAVARSRQKHSLIKEVKFRIATGEGDYQVKKRKIIHFLGAGDKVKLSLWFRGREIVHQRLGHKMINRLCEDLAEIALPEGQSSLEGKRLHRVLAPIKNPAGTEKAAGNSVTASKKPPAPAKPTSGN